MYHMGSYDVAVIGAGHAGVEAALAAARLGCKTVLFTISLDQIANIFTLNKDCGIVLHFSPVFDYANSAIDKDTFIKKIEAYNSNSGGGIS